MKKSLITNLLEANGLEKMQNNLKKSKMDYKNLKYAIYKCKPN